MYQQNTKLPPEGAVKQSSASQRWHSHSEANTPRLADLEEGATKPAAKAKVGTWYVFFVCVLLFTMRLWLWWFPHWVTLFITSYAYAHTHTTCSISISTNLHILHSIAHMPFTFTVHQCCRWIVIRVPLVPYHSWHWRKSPSSHWSGSCRPRYGA